jgi:hypothetical protein
MNSYNYVYKLMGELIHDDDIGNYISINWIKDTFGFYYIRDNRIKKINKIFNRE